MNLTLHLAAWDLRYLRHYLGLWLGLVVLQAFLIGYYDQLPGLFPFPGSRVLDVVMPGLVWVVAVLKICLLAVLVAQMVQKDSTVGSTAFWLSRPVSRVRLLAGKSLFLASSVVLPTLFVEAVLLLVCGVTAYDTLRSFPQMLFLTLLALAPLMMLAAVTTSLARMFLLGVLFFPGLPLLGFLLWFALSRVSHRPFRLSFLPDFGAGDLGAPLVLLSTAVIVTGCQYLTRRTLVSRVLLVSGVALSLLFLGSWIREAWTATGREGTSVDPGILDSAKIGARIEQDSLSLERVMYMGGRFSPFGRTEGNSVILRGTIALDPLPSSSGITVIPERIEAKLRLPSDSRILVTFGSQGSRWDGPSLIHLSPPIDLGKAQMLARHSRGVPRLLELDESAYERYRGAPLAYSAEVEFLVQRPEVAELQPTEGARLERGSGRTEIHSVGRAGSGLLTIYLSETSHRLRGEEETETRYLLVNRSRGQALRGAITDFTLYSPPLLWGPFPMLEVRCSKLEFRPPPDDFEMDAAWLDGAALIRLETIRLGHFSKSIRMEGLVLDQLGPLPPAPSLGLDDRWDRPGR